MTAPPSPPNRRRRRIVVVTIAVLVLGLGWWFWPRVDQRFVGTWGYPSYARSGSVSASPERPVFVLKAGGSGESLSLFNRTGTFRWWTRKTGDDRTTLFMLFPSTRYKTTVWYEYFLGLYTSAGWPAECEAWDAALTNDSLSIYAPGDRLDLIRLK